MQRLLGAESLRKCLHWFRADLRSAADLIAAKANFFPKEEIAGEHLVCEKKDIPAGGGRSFVIKGSDIPYLLIHLEDGSFKAYEQKCTHLSCAVYYKKGSGQIVCPCHNGFFNASDGSVIAGPPPRKLPHLRVIEKGDKIYVAAPSPSNDNENV
jgi:cytochrome b6-f complex iron-sulfur subunit